MLYASSVALTKISFLFFCLRIFPSRNIRIWLYGLIIVLAAHGFTFTIGTIFSCTPISYNWTHWDGEHKGKCINFNAFAWAHAVTNIVLDFVMLGIPVPVLLKLQLSMKKKIYIILMFSVGALYVKVPIFSSVTEATEQS